MSLTSADWLLKHIEDPGTRVLDVRSYLAHPGRGAREYAEGHIPGAVFLDLETDLSDLTRAGEGRHPLPNPQRLAISLGNLGIGDSHTIVAYDQGPSANAARAWWLLRHLGHRDARVLDGGMPAWLAADGSLSQEVTSHSPSSFTVSVRSGDTAGLEEVANRGGSILLDARAPERFRGEVEPIDPVPGRIPGAYNLPYEDLVGPDSRFLAPGELLERFREVEVTADSVVIVACGSGVTACHLALAAVTAGLPEPRLYPGSYSQWVGAGQPVETGPR